MKINIRQDLERPTRKGNTSIYTSLICRKEEADDVATKYIWDTIHNPLLIRTVKFAVFFRDYRGRLVHKFEYKPTYAED